MTSATGQVRGVGGRLALVFVMPPSPSHMCSLYSIELLYITPSFLLFPFPSYLSICCSFLFHITLFAVQFSLLNLLLRHLCFSHAVPAGSVYAGAVNFDVYKNTAPSTDTSADVVKVTVPRELRGASEILVFFSPKAMRGEPFCNASMHAMCVTLWGSPLLMAARDASVVCLSLSSLTKPTDAAASRRRRRRRGRSLEGEAVVHPT